MSIQLTIDCLTNHPDGWMPLLVLDLKAMVKVWFSEDNDMKVSLSEMGGSKLSGVVKPEPV